MATKLYDLVVKVGEYQQDGQPKGRYENVGSMMQGDNGPFLILKRTFNPAGVINPENKDSVIVSCFEQQNNQQQMPQGNEWANPQQAPQQIPQQAPQPAYSQAPQQPYGSQRG